MNNWSQQDIENFFSRKSTGVIYFYTPLCGTCQVAGKMLAVVEQVLPDLQAGKADLNYMPELADQLAVESVPCLILVKNGLVVEKLYAFRSVPHLLEKITQLDIFLGK